MGSFFNLGPGSVNCGPRCDNRNIFRNHTTFLLADFSMLAICQMFTAQSIYKVVIDPANYVVSVDIAVRAVDMDRARIAP